MAENLSTLSSDGLAGTPTGTGARYTAISTWESSQQADLVAAGDTEVLECYNGTTVEGAWDANGDLSDNVDIDGWTTGAGNGITIRAASGQGHNGVKDAGFGLISGLPAIQIRSSVTHVTIDGIRLHKTGDAFHSCLFTNAEFTTVKNLIVSNAGTHLSSNGIEWENQVNDALVENCLVYDFQNNGITLKSFGGGSVRGRNCTIYGCGTGFLSFGADNLEINNITCVDNTTDFDNVGSYIAGTTNNASSDSTAPGTSSQTLVSLTPGTDIVNYPTDLTPASGGKLDGTGTTPPLASLDIVGNTRNDPDDIGAYAIASAALTFSLSPDSSPLPAGLTVNSTTGNIEGTPTESGTFTNIIIRGSQ